VPSDVTVEDLPVKERAHLDYLERRLIRALETGSSEEQEAAQADYSVFLLKQIVLRMTPPARHMVKSLARSELYRRRLIARSRTSSGLCLRRRALVSRTPRRRRVARRLVASRDGPGREPDDPHDDSLARHRRGPVGVPRGLR
jgi:hypothetical protein